MLVSVCSGRQNKRSSRSYVCQENTVQYDPQVASQTDIVISVIYIPIHSTVKDLTDYDVKAMLTSDTWSVLGLFAGAQGHIFISLSKITPIYHRNSALRAQLPVRAGVCCSAHQADTLTRHVVDFCRTGLFRVQVAVCL